MPSPKRPIPASPQYGLFAPNFAPRRFASTKADVSKGTWILIDSPYTCEFRPSTNQVCGQENGLTACQSKDSCQWCSQLSVCKNEALECPTDPPLDQSPSSCEPHDQTLTGWDANVVVESVGNLDMAQRLRNREYQIVYAQLQERYQSPSATRTSGCGLTSR